MAHTNQSLDRYQIRKKIGAGGMGTVFHAWDREIERDVALKWLPESFSADPTFVERFRREARLIARLEHLHIVPIYDVGQYEGRPFIIMRLLNGGTLRDKLLQNELDLAQLMRAMTQVGDALMAAHARNIVHRDIKPANILFDENSSAFLSDFGIAKLLDAASVLTGSGIIGTPSYMSPEQFKEHAIDGRSDQYSLAVVLYEALTGRLPFEGNTAQMMYKHIHAPPPEIDPSALPELAGINRVLGRALAKQPEERYGSVREFVAAARQITNELTRQGSIALPLAPPLPAGAKPRTTSGAETKVDTPPLPQQRGTAEQQVAPPVLRGATAADQTTLDPSKPLAVPKPLAAQPKRAADDSGARPTATAPPPRPLQPTRNLSPATSKRVAGWMWSVLALVFLGLIVLAGWWLLSGMNATREDTESRSGEVTIEAGNEANGETGEGGGEPGSSEPVDPAQPTLAAEAAAIVRVTANSASLRAGPGASYPPLGQTVAGAELQVVAQDSSGEWYNVVMPGGERAWVAQEAAEPLNEADMTNLPVAATLPATATESAAATMTLTPAPSTMPTTVPTLRATNIPPTPASTRESPTAGPSPTFEWLPSPTAATTEPPAPTTTQLPPTDIPPTDTPPTEAATTEAPEPTEAPTEIPTPTIFPTPGATDTPEFPTPGATATVQT